MIRDLNKYERAIRERGHDVHRQQVLIINYFDRYAFLVLYLI